MKSRINTGLAREGEEEALIDFINMVFSQSGRPHDFPSLLPKLYGKGRFRPEYHYVVRDGTRPVAVVGSYPMEMRVADERLSLRGVGAVSVHPYHRGAGYMKSLMACALTAMQEEGVDLAVLSGKRNRYQYFGFEQAGARVSFTVNRDNVRHVLGRKPLFPFSLQEVRPGDAALLSQMRELHKRQPLRVNRSETLFYDVLCSWNARPWAVLRDGQLAGYAAVSERDGPEVAAILELVLTDEQEGGEEQAQAALYGFLAAWLGERGHKAVTLDAALYQTERLRALHALSEASSLRCVEQFRVFNFERVLRAFFGLKAASQTLPDGEWTVTIEGSETGSLKRAAALRLTVTDGRAAVQTLPTGASCQTTLDPLSATALLFSPAACFAAPSLPAHVQRWLPLPLFLSPLDST